MKTQQHKPMGFSKSSAKREVLSNASLLQETRETSSKPLMLHLEQLKQDRRTPQSAVGRKPKIRAEINEKEIKKTIAKLNKTKSWFFEKINKLDKPLSRTHQAKKKEESNQ